MIRRPPSSTRTDTLFPYTTLFRSNQWPVHVATDLDRPARRPDRGGEKPFWAALPLKPSTDAPMGRYRRPRSRDRRQMPCRLAPVSDQRSEEHTSELQSLLRISYAVFCLKKKKTSLRRTTQDN